MRRAVWIGVLVVALLSITATPSLAWRRAWSGGGSHSSGGWHGGHGHVHGRVVVGVSPWWGWGVSPWWGWGWPYPAWGYAWPPYAYPPYAYPGPFQGPVVAQEPQTYAQTAPVPAPAAPQQPKAYWYYCASAGAYYPTAPTCPEVWIKVPPRSE